MDVLILGATGGTGLQLTTQALERGHSVTAFVRSPERLPTRHARLGVVQGDPRDASRLLPALHGRDAVLSALGAASRHDVGILEAGARSTADAMRRTNVRRLVVVSMALLYPDLGLVGSLLRPILRHHLRDSAAMERVVEASGLDWTIVRPPRLTDGRPTGAYRVTEQHAPPGFTIARADLARAILDVVERTAYVGQVIGVSR